MYIVKQKNDWLMHYGTKGQKWGVRNYQYDDGSLTPAGKERYRNEVPSSAKAARRNEYKKSIQKSIDKYRPNQDNYYYSGVEEAYDDELDKLIDRLQTGEDFDYDEWFNHVLRDYNRSGDPERFESSPNGQQAMFEARIKALNTIYENTTQYKKLVDDANKKKNAANNLGKGSIPTSALAAKRNAEHARNEAKIKSNIPASAWNQRAKSR